MAEGEVKQTSLSTHTKPERSAVKKQTHVITTHTYLIFVRVVHFSIINNNNNNNDDNDNNKQLWFLSKTFYQLFVSSSCAHFVR